MRSNPETRFSRVGIGFLSFCSTTILVLTLMPFPEWLDQNRLNLCVLCNTSAVPDAFGNIFLFLPLGIALALRSHRLTLSVLIGMLFSIAIETVQFHIPGRDPSLQDILCNTFGTFLGYRIARSSHFESSLTSALSWCREVWDHWKRPHPMLAIRLQWGTVFVAMGVFASTAWLLSPTFPAGPYIFAGKEMDSGATPLRIGASGDGVGYYKGVIDEVRVYNRVLTPDQIRIDMGRPVDASSSNPSPGLVAAYGFEEKSGGQILDTSGQGNNGLLNGTVRTAGKFGRALMFNGHSDQVIIFGTSVLNLRTLSTLEAWIRPEVNRSGWPTVLQKEGDYYFLYTGPDLTPGGGGTFGGASENIQVAEILSEGVWSHLAMTYDGSILRLYINGRQVASIVRWFQGHIDEMSVGNVVVYPRVSVENSRLRLALQTGEVIRLRGITGPDMSNRGPFLDIQNKHSIHIFQLVADGDDLILRYITIATTLDLPSPEIRVTGALRNIEPKSPLQVDISRTSSGYSLSVNGVLYQRLGFTLGMGWTVLLYSEYLPLWLQQIFNLTWITVWAFPIGFWSRMRFSSLGAIVTFGICLWTLPAIGAFVATPSIQWVAAILSLLTGICIRLIFFYM